MLEKSAIYSESYLYAMDKQSKLGYHIECKIGQAD